MLRKAYEFDVEKFELVRRKIGEYAENDAIQRS